jgi:hypothetical protein
MAILKEAIYAVPDGAIHPKWFPAGAEVFGGVELAAQEQGKIQTGKTLKTKVTKPMERK